MSFIQFQNYLTFSGNALQNGYSNADTLTNLRKQPEARISGKRSDKDVNNTKYRDWKLKDDIRKKEEG
jgi:hypothetical protein